MVGVSVCTFFFFFFNDTATTEIYTLSLHDALPIFNKVLELRAKLRAAGSTIEAAPNEMKPADPKNAISPEEREDRKSTRLNSSHGYISYAVFCLKKKKKRNSMILTMVCVTIVVI